MFHDGLIFIGPMDKAGLRQLALPFPDESDQEKCRLPDELRKAAEHSLQLVRSAAPHVAKRTTVKLLKQLAEAYLAEHPVVNMEPMDRVPYVSVSLDTDRGGKYN